MGWLREENEKREKSSADRVLIREYAPNVFRDLWSAILEVVNDPQAQRFQLLPNGTEWHRDVRMGKNKLQVVLAEDRQSIDAVSDNGVAIRLDLRVGTDGMVYLAHKEEKLDPALAAQRIMKPFLFGF